MPALQLHETLALSDFTHFNADHSLPPSPSLADAIAYALQKCPGFKFLPSNFDSLAVLPPNAPPASAHFACDDFRIYEFKVRRCMRGRSHDWTECPFAHPGEKARRRDPRRIHYSGSPCPDFRKGSCRRGDACEFAHGVFECWLHPARYRTQVCKDGQNCKRRVCFFAHSPEQLRILPQSTAACDPTSMQPLTDKADSSENLPANEISLPNSVGTSHAHQLHSPSAMSSPLSPSQMNPISIQRLDSTNGSALRRAMVQNFLACKGYGVNLNAAEYSPACDSYEMHAEVQTTGTSHHRMQPLPIRNGHNESLFSRFNLPVEKSSYELGSHGFASPTSTLAGHIFSPPPLSPPLSPLTSPNSNIIKESFTNPGEWHSYYVNDTAPTHINPTFAYNNMSNMEDLGFSLQNLHIAHANEGGYISQSPCTREQAGQVSIPTQKIRQPFKHSASNLSCVSNQSLWGSPSSFASSNCSNFDYLGVDDDAYRYEVSAGKVGEESASIDNSIPDLGWVSELVK